MRSSRIPTLLLLLSAFSLRVAAASPPNILFILTDDQAPWALGASGNPQVHTPHLDLLAREGAYLPNAFVTTPVCSPARAALMTGRYASEFGILDFIPQPGHKLYQPDAPIGLPPEAVTFAEVLQENGYTTGLVGKWHLGDWTQTPDPKFHPTQQGFDHFMGLTGGGTSPKDPPLEKDGQVRTFKGLTTDILTDNALEFLRAHARERFLLCVHYRAPHGPWLPVAKEDWAPYDKLDPAVPHPDYPDLNTPRVKQRMREYLASTSGVDRNLGRLLDKLRELGLERNTVVIFTSDHGYNMGHNGIEHKGNGIWITRHKPAATPNIDSKYRPNLYDNSLRVPVVVRWPGVIAPGLVVTETASSVDWFPTLLEMADAAVPEGTVLRGRSLVPLLKGKMVADWNFDFYAEYSMINYCRAYMRCWRTPEWKLVRDFLNPERDECYDLVNDPQERVNLIRSEREDVRQAVNTLHARILDRLQKIGDPLLEQWRSGGLK